MAARALVMVRRDVFIGVGSCDGLLSIVGPPEVFVQARAKTTM
jgi:hypothetical protein